MKASFFWINDYRFITVTLVISFLNLFIGCGKAPINPTVEGFNVTTTFDTNVIDLKQTESASLIVDISSDVSASLDFHVAGYNIDMPETVSGIEIETSSCDTGVGSTSCESWTITPSINTTPGTYRILVTPNSSNLRAVLISNELVLNVHAHVDKHSAPAALAIANTSNVFHILTLDQKRWSWGNEFITSNDLGAVGVGGYFNQSNQVMPDNVNVAAQDTSSIDWLNIDGNYTHGLSLNMDGEVYSWGKSSTALGYTTTEHQLSPKRITELNNVTQVATSRNTSFALVGGEVIVWGSNEFGLYGNGTQDSNDELTFNTVPNLTDIIQISAGWSHVLALANDGRVYAWGDNSYGQLGAGSEDVRTSPIQVLGFTNITQISAAGNFSLALSGDSRITQTTLWSWGDNNNNQLGIASEASFIGSPQQITGIGNIREISAMYQSNQSMGFAIQEEFRTVWRWGGELTRPRELPIQVKAIGAGHAIDLNCPNGQGGFLWDLRPSPVEPPRLISIFGKDDSTCLNRLFLNKIGMGTVTATPSEDNSVEGYIEPTDVVLTATPDPGWQIDPSNPWIDNEDCNDGIVTVKGGVQCIANFIPSDSKLLTVSKFGTGDGVIKSDISAIDCGISCSANIVSGETVVLTATANTESDFTGWTGTGNCTSPDSVIDNMLTVTLTEDSDCQASFSKKSFILTVAKNGNGDGSVVSDISAIDCGADCDASLDINTQVILTATPDTNSTFASWSGTGDCQSPTTLIDNSITITVSQDSECVAVFDPISSGEFILTVIINGGPGAGEVNSSETPIPLMQCLNSAEISTTCTVPYPADSGVTLVPSLFLPNNTYNVTGCDSFTGVNLDCFVNLDQNKTVTFNMEQVPEYDISASISGNGSIISFASGAEVGVTGRINCPTVNCDDTFVVPSGSPTAVAFEAHPDTGSAFVSWGVGQCDSEQVINGVGICTIDLVPNSPAVRQVDATFQ